MSAIECDPDDLDVMVRTVFGEARGEPYEGQLAVAWCIRNRAAYKPPAWWGRTIGQVCLKPRQFSCWNDSKSNASNKAQMLALKPTDRGYGQIEAICRNVVSGIALDPTGGADHYKRAGTAASWDDAVKLLPPLKIGHHYFYHLGPFA